MQASSHEALDDFFQRFGKHPDNRQLTHRWQQSRSEQSGRQNSTTLLGIYASATAFTEAELSRQAYPQALLELYHRLFRELESHWARHDDDNRYEFIVVIPVADRPQHLENCLNSLLGLCRCFAYGGLSNHSYKKVTALIADDSKQPENIQRNRDITVRLAQQGLKTYYFGQAEQLQQLDRLTRLQKESLVRITGDRTRKAFYHKGASIMRNICYLKLNELAGDNPHRLFWFMDSDQEFLIAANGGDRRVYAINYFHHLNQIFSTTDTLVLTGKVIGDPPVSPAVMAGTFLQDVIAFLSDMALVDPKQICQFHNPIGTQGDDAAYHDMADLFGFKQQDTAFHYQCRLTSRHDHMQCFDDFSQKLKRFFDGEHPTRQTLYEHQEFHTSVKPARTVYTGNYILRDEAIQDFIPFATLKLRMAGPVLGRILQAEKGQRFVSANLPLLHKRTIAEIGQSEFRPGINRQNDQIDLSGEFERQFYGDVMLFTMEELTAQGYPAKPLAKPVIEQTLSRIEARMHQTYSDKHKQILARLEILKTLFDDPRQWWNRDLKYPSAKLNFQSFIHNMEHNFGEEASGYRMISSESHRQQRLNQVLEALLHLPHDRLCWQQALANAKPTDNPPRSTI